MRARCNYSGKVRYPTHTSALLALVEVVFDLEGRMPDRTKCPCRTYECRHCRSWHLTSMPWPEGLPSTANHVDSTQVSRDTELTQREAEHHGTHR